MNNFEKQNQMSRNEYIKWWSNYIKTHKNWQSEHNKLINSIFLQSKIFYENLLKTESGVNKVIKKFNIGNKRIIKRLKKNISKKNEKLIFKENDEFVYI